MIPLTILVLGAWWVVDRRSGRVQPEDEQAANERMDKIEDGIMRNIRRRTGARLATGLEDSENQRLA